MPQYRLPPRLPISNRDTRYRRFHDSFRIAGSGDSNVDAVEARGSIISVSSNTAMSSPVQNVIVDASGGNVKITLPESSAYPGIDVRIKRKDIVWSNHVTVQRAASDTIDNGLTSVELHKPKEAITLIADGLTGWLTIGRYVILPGHPNSIEEDSTNPKQLDWYHLLYVATNTTAANQTVYLPRVEVCQGQTIYIKRRSVGVNTQIQTYPGGTGSIDQGVQSINSDWGYRGFYCDGAKWRVVSRKG